MKAAIVILAASLLGACVVVYEPDSRAAGTTAVCHKGKQTLVLPDEAVRAHLGHGDSIGPCRSGS